MNKALAGGFLGLFVVVAAACSVNDGSSDEATASDTSDLKAKKCGGFVANPQTCPSGYTCVANKIPDLPGTCKKTKAPTCVENVICAINAHFDTTLCKCVPNTCVEKVFCTTTSHFDSTLCKCVPNAV